MELFDLAANWPEDDQVRANLLRLNDEAQSFVTADREALAGGGYYGSGLKTFLSWLGSRLGGREGDRLPDAQVHDEEAVQLVTWHSAKGREWPVVIVATLDRKVGGKLPGLDIQYTDFGDLDRILDNARLEFSPSFAASETVEHFLEELNEKAYREGLNLLYVALTRARETLILEWQCNLKNSREYKYWHLLRDKAAVRLEANKLMVGDEAFSCRITSADKEPPPEFDSPAAIPEQKLSRVGRRALEAGSLPENPVPLFVTPSRLPGQLEGDRPGTFNTDVYGEPLKLEMPPGAGRGLLIHRAVELLGREVSPDTVRALLEQEIPDSDWNSIQEMVRVFMKYLKGSLEPSGLHWEVPVTSLDSQGAVVGGTIDLLVETPGGFWIVDHKSDEPDNLEETFVINHSDVAAGDPTGIVDRFRRLFGIIPVLGHHAIAAG